MKYIKNKKGFTLVEIIIAIASLAIICGFILQIFILATKVNERAIDKQNAINESSNIIEVFNSLDNINDIYDNNYFIDYTIDRKDEKIKMSGDNSEYNLHSVINITNKNGIYQLEISIYKNNKLVLDNSIKAAVILGEK